MVPDWVIKVDHVFTSFLSAGWYRAAAFTEVLIIPVKK